MKTLTAAERHELAGPYVAPEGLYEYTKSLPFVGKVWSNVQTLTAGEWTEIVINFEVGASGLADGAWIKGTFKFYSVRRSLASAMLASLINITSLVSRIGLCFRHPIVRRTTMSAPSTWQTLSGRDRSLLRCKASL